jgi:hypothetical protein
MLSAVRFILEDRGSARHSAHSAFGVHVNLAYVDEGRSSNALIEGQWRLLRQGLELKLAEHRLGTASGPEHPEADEVAGLRLGVGKVRDLDPVDFDRLLAAGVGDGEGGGPGLLVVSLRQWLTNWLARSIVHTHVP